MALIGVTYCNASIAKAVTVQFNDVTFVIDSYVLGGDCPYGGMSAGTKITTIYVDGTGYEIRVQNYAPYAYVTIEPVVACEIDLISATPTNSSTNLSNDGSIVAAATGNGTVVYRIDSGEWQLSGNFTGLAPGTYNVQARTTLPNSAQCFDSQNVTVGYDDVGCDLELGTISGSNTAGVGSLVVENYTATPVEPVEYRVDAGAWQDSPVFGGLGTGTVSVQIRFKNFTACGDSRNVDIAPDPINCDIILTAYVTPEQTKYGNNGIIYVIASSSNGAIQYSKDNGANYQSGSSFYNLAPGSYTVRVKDAAGCESFVTATVARFKSIYVHHPIVNGHRVVITSGPVKDNRPQNFDNRLFADMIFEGGAGDCYYELAQYETRKIQWRSSYNAHTVKVYNKNTGALIITLIPVKKTSNLSKPDNRSGNFANAGANQTQGFFNDGLPDVYAVGQYITISGEGTLNGTYPIKDIRAGTGSATGFQVIVFDKIWTSGSALLSANIDTIYDALPFDYWEVEINWGNFGEGDYYFIVTGSDTQFANYEGTSEPVRVRVKHANSLLIEYRNNDDSNKVLYATGIVHAMRVEAILKNPQGGGDRVVYEDSNNDLTTISETVQRNPEFNIGNAPYYILERLDIAFSMDNVTVDGVAHAKPENMERIYFDMDALGNGKIKLRQKDFNNENSDDSGEIGDDSIFMDVNGEFLQIEP